MSEKVRSVLKYLGLAVMSGAWFSFLQPWGKFMDPDAFYHAKMAELMLAHGTVRAFPWLDLTALGTLFADQHYAFHVALLPFVKWFGGLLGTQIAAVVFATVCILVVYWSLGAIGTTRRWPWMMLALLSAPFVFRLSLGKASPLAIGWFLIGMVAILRRKKALALFAGFGFALTHGGWSLLLLCQSAYVFGQIVFVRLVLDRPLKTGFLLSAWRVPLVSALGVGVGLLIHPDFLQTIAFVWSHVIHIAISTPINRVDMGQEWLPVELYRLIIGNTVLAIGVLLLVTALIFAHKKRQNIGLIREIAALAFPVGILIVLTLKSTRFFEYAFPLLVLFLAKASELIDTDRLKQTVREQWADLKTQLPKSTVRPLILFVSLAMVGIVVRDVAGTYVSLRATGRAYDEFRPATEVIARLTEPDQRVYHTRWDEFPELFYWLDRQRYISGMDPTFLLLSEPKLAEENRDLVLKKEAKEISRIIREDFQSRILFSSARDPKEFWKTLDADADIELVYADPFARVYVIHEESASGVIHR